MRKVLSLVLVAAMLLGGIMITTSVSAVTELENNVAANAYYFDGSVVYYENYGDKGADYNPEFKVKSGNPDHILTLDGVIEEGEWGDNAIHVDAAYAANNLSPTGAWLVAQKNDAVYTHPSAENTYFYGNAKIGDSTFNNKTDRSFFHYDLYFMWDEDFLYVGAHVNDPYNHQNIHTGAECWEGDAIQFMVDTEGPNSRAVAEGQTYAYVAEHDIFHDTSSGQDVVTYANNPWNGTVVGNGGALFSSVPNIIAAYNPKTNGGYTELWDAALRYNPWEQEFNNTDEKGEVFVDHRTIWETAGIQDGYQDDYWMDQEVGAYATVRPTNNGSVKEPNYSTDYEIAIPWEIVTRANQDSTGTSFQDTFIAEAGKELGISVACLNASKPGNDSYDSWLTWGSGVCGSQSMYDYQTAGGSNLLTLVAENYAEHVSCVHEFTPASCTAPETCTKCGYQRGFETGHSYVCTNEVLPTADADGSVVATCTVCHDVQNLTLAKTASEQKVSFSESDSRIPDKMSSGWQENWFDSVDDPDTEGRQGNMLYYKDENGQLKAKTSYDNTTFGYAVADCATRGDGLFLVDGTPAVFNEEFGEVNFSTQTGTYFDTDLGLSRYTYKMEVMPTDYTIEPKDKYVKGIYNWFGKKAADYMAGLFVFGAEGEDATPTYLFAIANTDMCNPLYKADDLETFEANCEVYVEVPYEKVKTGEWHEWVFMYDDDAQYASLYWDGEQMVSAYNPQFKHLGTPYVLFRRMNIPFYAKNVEYGTVSYINEFIGAPSGETYTATINGAAAEYAEGATVTLTASKGEKYNDADKREWRFGGWTGDIANVADAAKAETTLTMPAANVVINEFYFLVGDLNDDGKINAVDANIIKQMVIGSTTGTLPADINGDKKVNAVDANLLKALVLGS